VAVVLLLMLVMPIVLFQRAPRRRRMAMRRPQLVQPRSVARSLGFAFLYLPIVDLMIYSFNASRLVTVWGGWSTALVLRAACNDPRCWTRPG
jgi:ABC-type spermidine/putrescine transport system permease subunit II